MPTCISTILEDAIRFMTPTLVIQLLGAPQVLLGGRPVTSFPSSKVSGLLYLLATEPRPRSRETLAGTLWPDYDATQAKKNLRGALYHLRKSLDPYLEVQRNEIGLRMTDAVEVDVVAFEAALSRARRHEEGSDAQLAELAAAVARYRGPFLEGFGPGDSDLYEEWIESERRRLHERAIQALNRLVAAAIERQDLLLGIEHATHLLSLDPLRDESHRDLILLLALDGQTQSALDRYEEYVDLLEQEVGAPPGPDTTALAERIRAGDFEHGAALRIVAPRRKLHNLPAELEPIIDRDDEEAWILDAFAEPNIRLVTIAGLGGMGKTRLALHIGHHYAATLETDEANGAEPPLPDGVFFVDLAGLEAGPQAEEQIAAAIASALQFNLDGVSPAQLADALTERRLLLILDNFELLQGAGGLLTMLQERAPGLRILVTSRTRLGVRGERVIFLQGLPTPPAEDEPPERYPATVLFLRAIASRTDGAVVGREEIEAVAATCRLLHGLPLGIELAAAWSTILTPTEILREVRRGLDFLQSDMPDLPERHRSLRAVFERTWRQLNEDERNALVRLAVFRGGFSHKAAEAVAGADLVTLRRLMDKALIRYQERADIKDSPRGGRYEIAEILRQYAAERLEDPALYLATRTRHACYYFEFLADLADELRSGDQPGALDAIEDEIDNVRAALQWLEEDQAPPQGISHARFRLGALALFDFFDIRGWFHEGDAVFKALAGATERETGAGDSLAAQFAARHAWFAFHMGRSDASLAALRNSLAELHHAGAEEATVFNLNYLGAVLLHLGRLEEAVATLTEARRVAEKVDDRFGASIALNTLGQAALRQGDSARAEALCEEALALKRAVNDRRGIMYALTTLGRIAQQAGRDDEARRLYGEALQISEELADRRGVGLAQRNLGDVAFAREELSSAQRMYDLSLENLRATGSRGEIAAGLIRLARVEAARRQADSALDLLREALPIALDTGADPALVAGLLVTAAAQLQVGETARAVTLLQALQASGCLDEAEAAWVSAQLAGHPAATSETTDLSVLAQRTLGYLERRAHSM
jgi:DNA-binding SARP family transcriptional activator/predicted ATPase/Tfp pilus assembly protein PilF